MLLRSLIGAIALLAGLNIVVSDALAFDESKYPQWRGQWRRIGGVQWDPSKKLGRDEQPPLKPQYQALFEASLADQAAGGQGQWQGARCLAVGMPGMMTLFRPMEIVVLPDVTYIRIDHIRDSRRRIFTDGRAWSEDIRPSFDGYSIGKWSDTDHKGRFDTLEVETRNFKGPRTYENSGLPLHPDNEGIIKERIYLDKDNPDLLHDEITSIDHALTRPWTVTKTYRRDPKVKQPTWHSAVCASDNSLVRIHEDAYFVSPDGYLMPIKKDQAPPDLRYFKLPPK